MLTNTLFSLAASAVLTAQSPSSTSLTFQRTIPLNDVAGRIDHLAVDRDGKRLYVAALGNGSIEVVDLAAGTQIGRVGGLQQPQGIAYVASTKQVIFTCGGDGTCRAIDAASLKEVAKVDAGADADNIRIDEERSLVYVGFEPGIAILELDGLKKRGVIELTGHAESFQLDSDGARIFVNVPDTKHVQVVNRDSGSTLANWPLKDTKKNYPMALDSAGNRLFVICRDPSRLLALDTETGKTLASVDCVGDADDVFFDARSHHLYVSGGEGFIDVFDIDEANHIRRLERVTTAHGARTCLLDFETSTLYLAVPKREDHPAEIRQFKLSTSP